MVKLRKQDEPDFRTMVYREVMKRYDGITAVTIAKHIDSTIDRVLPVLQELHHNKHIEIKKGGGLVRVEGHKQTFAKYVLYN